MFEIIHGDTLVTLPAKNWDELRGCVLTYLLEKGARAQEIVVCRTVRAYKVTDGLDFIPTTEEHKKEVKLKRWQKWPNTWPSA